MDHQGRNSQGQVRGQHRRRAHSTPPRTEVDRQVLLGVPGIFVTSILGVKPTGSDYWELLVNGKAASKGVCGVEPHAGERLLFEIVK